MKGYETYEAVQEFSKFLPLATVLTLKWENLQEFGRVGSGLWRCEVQINQSTRRVSGVQLSHSLEELKATRRGPWVLEDPIDPAHSLPVQWAQEIQLSREPIPNMVLRFGRWFEVHLMGLRSKGVIVSPTTGARRVVRWIRSGGSLSPEDLCRSSDPLFRELATYLDQNLVVPLPVVERKVVEAKPISIPPPIPTPVPPRPRRPLSPRSPKVPRVPKAPRVPKVRVPKVSEPIDLTPQAVVQPIPEHLLSMPTFGTLRMQIDPLCDHVARGLKDQLPRSHAVALVEGILSVQPTAQVTQEVLTREERRMALHAESLIRAVPSGPLDLLHLAWGHLRVFCSNQGMDLPPWVIQPINPIRDDQDLARALWTAFGPRGSNYVDLEGTRRRSLSISEGVGRIRKGNAVIIAIRGENAVLALRQILQWGGDSETQVYPERPLIPARSGSNEHMTGSHMHRILLDNGFPLTGVTP